MFNTGQNTDLSFSGLALGVLGMLLVARRRKENKK
ncbi:LPXTG cell wall anchor domain-containing protein [Gemella bergeri]